SVSACAPTRCGACGPNPSTFTVEFACAGPGQSGQTQLAMMDFTTPFATYFPLDSFGLLGLFRILVPQLSRVTSSVWALRWPVREPHFALCAGACPPDHEWAPSCCSAIRGAHEG